MTALPDDPTTVTVRSAELPSWLHGRPDRYRAGMRSHLRHRPAKPDHHGHSRSIVGLAAVALVAALTACTPAPDDSRGAQDSSIVEVPEATPEAGEPTPGSQVPTAPATGNAAAWCALAPTSLIAETLDLQLREPTASFTPEEVRCTYLPVAEGAPSLQIRYRIGQDHASFAALRASTEDEGAETAELPGVGDEAFYTATEFEVIVEHTVFARRGTVVVVVSAPATIEDATELIGRIVAQLG